jgi:neutral trehalase
LWAEEPLLALFDHQEEDGRIPLSAVPNGPNPEQSQPPLIAWGVWELHRQFGHVDFLRECYEPLERYLEWFCRERDRNGNGLLEWHKDEESAQCHCGESGYDNSPRFDHPGLDDALDLSCYVANEMRLLAQIGRRIGAEAADDWQQRGDDLARRINELLWDEQRGMYFDRRDSGEWVAIKTTAGFMPLWAGVASPKQAARLVEHLRDEREFATPFPVPTVAADEPTHSDDMWRGPTWINTNYLIFRGLVDYGFREEAAALREVTMRQIQHWYEQTGCLWEFYDCQGQTDPYHLRRKGGAAGVGHWTPTIADYGWTAALYIALAHEAPVG